MARFYFHVHDRNGYAKDPEGADFSNLEDAMLEASSIARDLGKQYIDDRETILGHHVDVCDWGGAVLATVLVEDVLEHPSAHPKNNGNLDGDLRGQHQ